MRGLGIKILLIVTGAVVSAAIGFGVAQHQKEQDGKIRYLDFQAGIANDFLYTANGLEDSLSLLVGEERIDHISQVYITVYNGSDQDYKDLPISIELFPQEGDTLKVINSRVSGFEGNQDFVESNHELGKTDVKGSIKLGYTLKAANRVGDEPVFSALVLIDGRLNENKAVQINAITPSVQFQHYDASRFYKTPIWEREAVILTFIYTCLGIYLFLILWIIRDSQKERQSVYSRYHPFLTKFLKKEDIHLETEEELQHLINRVSYLIHLSEWKRTKGFMRRLMRFKRPQPQTITVNQEKQPPKEKA